MTDKSKPKKPVVSVLFSLGIYFLILALAYYFLSHVFHNDSNADKSDYVEQGIVIFVSVTSALISFITNRITSYNNNVDKKEQIERENEIREKQKAFESKWNQAKIDADIISKARIAWIENVRHATSQFIASCYSLIRITKLDFGDEMNSKHLSAKENGLLLMLYFGPDSQSNEDNTSNSGKNNEIYKLISESLNLVEKLYSKEKNKELKDEINSRIDYVEILRDNLPSLRTEEREIVDDDGYVCTIPVEIYDESTPQYLEYREAQDQLNRFKFENSPQKLESLLDKLTDEIRKYLKIEWDVAKKGK